jgi:hypothetical protein
LGILWSKRRSTMQDLDADKPVSQNSPVSRLINTVCYVNKANNG